MSLRPSSWRARRLFGAHVGRGPDRHPGLGQPVRRRRLERAGDAEVGHQRLAVGEQDVLRLDVAMDHALAVGMVERVGDLPGDAEGLVDRQLRSSRSRSRSDSPST